eukprot:3938777-Rhodomonas_salina.2
MKPESQDAMPKDPAMQGATKMDVDEEKESDSDSSSMSDDDDEEEIDETIAILELRLKTCGGRDYEAHAELMRILREKNMMKKLEKAREAFSREFPLTDDVKVGVSSYMPCVVSANDANSSVPSQSSGWSGSAMNCVLPSQTMTKRVFRLCMRGLLRITAQPVCGSHMLLMSSNATQRVMQEARRKKSCCARRETLSRGVFNAANLVSVRCFVV